MRILLTVLLLMLFNTTACGEITPTKLPAVTALYTDIDGKAYFDPQRIPVELQSWWTPDFGHIHGLAMVPLGQQVSGTLDFPVRVVLHDNPSTLKEVRIDNHDRIIKRFPLQGDCSYDGINSTNCAFEVPVSLNVSDFDSGWNELRIRTEATTPDGKRYVSSSGIGIKVGNSTDGYKRSAPGNNLQDTQHHLIGRGYYDGDYTNAWISNVPLTPVKGTHTFHVRVQKPSQHLDVVLDRTHPIPATQSFPAIEQRNGETLFSQDGNFQDWQAFDIDTTRLQNGWHTFAARSVGTNGATSECEYCTDEINFSHGVAKVWFFVDNPITSLDQYNIMSNNWGLTNVSYEDGDFNLDNIIDARDAAILFANWNNNPEPIALCLFIIGTFCVFSFFRRFRRKSS